MRSIRSPHADTPWAISVAGCCWLINVAMIFLGPKLATQYERSRSNQADDALKPGQCGRMVGGIFHPHLPAMLPEPVRKIEKDEEGQNVWRVGFARFFKALGISANSAIFSSFLLAFFIYSNGIGTIIYMAVAFGNDLGFSSWFSSAPC